MKDKLIKTKEVLESILGDLNKVKKNDLTNITEAITILETAIEKETFIKTAESLEDLKKVIDSIDILIQEYKNDILAIRRKSISYQENEGSKVIEMLNKYIAELTKVRNSIIDGDYLNFFRGASVEDSRDMLFGRLINILNRNALGDVFVTYDASNDYGVVVDYEKIDRLFQLLDREDVISEIAELIPIAKSKLKAESDLVLAETRLHEVMALKEVEDKVRDYVARYTLATKQDTHISELISDLGTARRELRELRSETKLFQAVCKDEINAKAQEVKEIRFAKEVAKDIKAELERKMDSYELEFHNLNIFGLVQKILHGAKVSNGVEVPSFLRRNYQTPGFGLVSERRSASYIDFKVEEILKGRTKRYNDAETTYNDINKEYLSAFDTLSSDAKDIVSYDLTEIVQLHEFVSNIKEDNCSALISLFVLKLLNDASTLSYNEMIEVFLSDEEIEERILDYRVILSNYAYGKNQEVCNIQDRYMLDSQEFKAYSKVL